MHKDVHQPAGERDYSDRDIPIGKIMVAGVYIAIFTLVTFVALRFLFLHFDKTSASNDAAVSTFAAKRVLPPEPRLLVDEPTTWAKEHARQQAMVDGYEILDPKTGVVRIPVERAMDLVAEAGLPVRAQPEAAK